LPFVAPGASVTSDVTLGEDSSVWYGATLRGSVRLGERSNVQDNCVVEGTPDQPAIIGPSVTLGHNARVFSAVVQERSMIAIGATVLPGACVGAQSIIAANATVPEGMQVPPRSLVVGSGRVLREVTQAEIDRIDRGTADYVRLANQHAASASPSGGGLNRAQRG
jgi:carbonic anhydrase/acetyltransferase-like protein (isoleucine patch superfamily)